MLCRTHGAKVWPSQGTAAPGARHFRGKTLAEGAQGRKGARGGARPPCPADSDARRPAGGSLPLRGRPRWDRGSTGRGGKAAGRGCDLWAFQESRCLLGPPIVSLASQWGCCSRSAGPRCGLHGREGPGAARAIRPSRAIHPPRARRCVRPRILCAPLGVEQALRARRLTLSTICLWGPPVPPSRWCTRGRGARSSCAVGHPAPPGWHCPRCRVLGTHTGAHSSRLPATIWQIRDDIAALAHSGAECPATGNNHNSVRVYYGCEPARKRII